MMVDAVEQNNRDKNVTALEIHPLLLKRTRAITYG